MFAFGSGVLLGTRTDVANATPVNFGLVWEVRIDLQSLSRQSWMITSSPSSILISSPMPPGNVLQGSLAQVS